MQAAVDYSDEAVDARIAALRPRWQAVQAAIPAPPPRPKQPLPLDFRNLAREKAPPRRWFLPGWLGPGPTLLAGSGGSGKSTLVQHAATALAAGRPYFAECDAPLRSLVLNAEDDHDELWRRQEAICEHEQIDMPSLCERLIVQPRFGHDSALMVETRTRQLEETPLMDWLREYCNDMRTDVLWLDNAAHMLLADHDDRTTVTYFINALNGLVTGRPFAVVIVAHPGRAIGSEYSGSVAWENAVRMRWFLGSKLPDQKPDDDEPTGSTRFLCKRKSNYSAQDYVRLEMRGGGLLVPDGPVGHVGGLVAALDEEKAEEVVLDGLRRLTAMGIKPSDKQTSPDHLPRQMLQKNLARGYTKAQLERAMGRLMAAGTLTRGIVGQYSNRTPREGLVLAEPQR